MSKVRLTSEKNGLRVSDDSIVCVGGFLSCSELARLSQCCKMLRTLLTLKLPEVGDDRKRTVSRGLANLRSAKFRIDCPAPLFPRVRLYATQLETLHLLTDAHNAGDLVAVLNSLQSLQTLKNLTLFKSRAQGNIALPVRGSWGRAKRAPNRLVPVFPRLVALELIGPWDTSHDELDIVGKKSACLRFRHYLLCFSDKCTYVAASSHAIASTSVAFRCLCTSAITDSRQGHVRCAWQPEVVAHTSAAERTSNP